MRLRSYLGLAGLTDLEADVLALIVKAHPQYGEALEAQLATARIASRRMTGLGFFLNFAVGDAPLLEPASFQLNEVYGQVAGLEHGAGFVLYVRAGKIDFLEGHGVDEPWPAVVEGHQVFIQSPPRGVVH